MGDFWHWPSVLLIPNAALKTIGPHEGLVAFESEVQDR